MITIVCGEDIATSRNYYVQLKRQYTQKSYEIKDIAPQEIYELPRWLGEATTLFGTKQIFFVERLESIIVRRRGRKSAKSDVANPLEIIISKLAADREIEIIDWEDKGGRELKLKDAALIKEFKPDKSIFKLMDSFQPGNKLTFISLLEELSDDHDETFIFIMLYRHVRALMLAAHDSFAKTVQSWQRGKLRSQAMAFPDGRLIDIYKALYRLEVTSKTGTNPYGLRKGLEILACYYL